MENIISEFISNSCAIRPRPNLMRFLAIARACEHQVTDVPDSCNIIQTTSGSVSEFYIEPMISFIGDVDIMWFRNDKLVVSSVDRAHGHTELPPEFHTHDEIEVYEMVNSQFPGYVFIRLVGKLIKSGQQNIYVFQPSGFHHTLAEVIN
jgi:hypothetical protein